MKRLFLLFTLLICFFINAQENGNYPIPPQFIGYWVSTDGSDSITITDRYVSWTSNDSQPYFSFVDYIEHADAILFTFFTMHNPFKMTLNLRGRKLIMNAIENNDTSRKSETYFKEVRTKE